jgi:ligand-binding sensor domain-containing protein/signal transduction histidine kinase
MYLMRTKDQPMHKSQSVIGLCVLMFALLFPFPAEAQVETIRFERLTVEDGLSQNAVLTIVQDHQGFLWFGTEDGLNKYDGYQFTVYQNAAEDPSSLADNYVSTLLVDREGALWIGTRSGLDRYNREEGTFTHVSGGAADDHSYQGKWVTSLLEDQEGRIWVGTYEGGLSRMDPGTRVFTYYVHDEDNPSSLSGNAVSVTFEDSNGSLWVGTQNGLDRFEGSEQGFLHFQNTPGDSSSLSGNSVTAICEDDRGYLWVGTGEGGLNRFDPEAETFHRFGIDPNRSGSISHERVRAIHQDHLGNLWIGTQNGLDLIAAEELHGALPLLRFRHYRNDPFDPESLSSSAVWSIFEDHSGVMWFGTYGGGLSKYNRSTERFKLFRHSPSQSDSLSDNIVWSILEDSHGILWVGTFNGGLNRLERAAGLTQVYRHSDAVPNSLLGDDVRALLEDSEGRLWVGSAGGLDRMSADQLGFTHYTHDPGDPSTLSGDRVNVLLQSRSGSIWVGTRYEGLNRLDPESGEIERFVHDPNAPASLGEDRVWALYEDRRGALWVGTLGGVSVLEPGGKGFSHYQHDPQDPSSLSSDSIFAFHEDDNGNMWIGTWGGGLDRLDLATGEFEHFTEANGLPNDTIYGIEADAAGSLWMSTNRGLAKFDPGTKTFETFDVSDGLQDNEFNVGAHFKSESGEMFFGGVRGFNAFFPEEINRNTTVPAVVITTFYIFNEPIRHDLLPGETIELSHRQNFIAFEFAALDFNAPDKNQYAYRLDGLDGDWIEAGTRRYASYTNLEGGEYVFRVKGSNTDGAWNEEGASLQITVIPPIWDRDWFRLMAFFMVIGLVFGGHRLRVRAVEARSRELESLVQARTQEIEQRKDELSSLYRADGELIQHLEMEQVFQALVEIAVEILHADKGILHFWDEAMDRLEVRAAKGFAPESLREIALETGESIVGTVLANGRTLVIPDAQKDPRVSKRIVDSEGIRSVMYVPIRMGESIYGVFGVGYTTPKEFGPEEERLFSALAGRAALAIEQAQLQVKAKQAAVLEERGRLARDLHDAVTQTLFSASMVAEVLPTLWQKDPELGRSRLEKLRDLTRGALAEMRTLLIELRPAAIAEADLEDLMRQLAESTTGRAQIPVDLQVQGECSLDVDEKVALYRIAQEALNNVAKHSKASAATVKLACSEATVDLSVQDDGLGIDLEKVTSEHMGLMIMKERADAIGADLSVLSKEDGGTTVRVRWNRRESQVAGEK